MKLREIDSKYIILLFILVGFTFRIVGFHWGSREMIFQPDEYNVVNPIITMTESQSLVHENWTYPSMCSSKIIAFVLMLISNFYTLEWIEYYYVVRFFYVITSSLIIFLSYLLIKQCEDEKTALFLSFFISVCPIFVKYSKQAVGDTPVMAFWLLTALYACRYMRKNGIKEVVLMSLFAACASVEKWNGIGITILIAIIVIYRNRKDIYMLILHGIISFSSWLMFVFVLAPNLVTDCKRVFGSIRSSNPSLGSYLIQGHLETFFSYSGFGSIICFLAGVYWLVSRNKDSNSDNTVSFIPYLMVFVGLLEDWLLCEQLVERHGLIIFWGCTLIILQGYYYISSHLKAKSLGNTLVALLFVAWVLQCVMIDTLALKSLDCDTRIISYEQLQDLGVNASNSFGESYTPFNPPIAAEVMDLYNVDDVLFIDASGRPCISIPNKKYVIISEYSYTDRLTNGYDVLRNYGKSILNLNSEYDGDLFILSHGCGNWSYSELDTIRITWKTLFSICRAASVGPWIEAYDISDFYFVAQ